jgi:hypothetical protein
MTADAGDTERPATEQLEAVGREAARVAHDLNNLLQIIVGFGDLLAAELPTGSAQHRAATNILDAATTATARARQLVALGRRARAIPAVIDVSVAMLTLGERLCRLGGDALQLRLTLPDTPMPIRIAPAALEQLLLRVISPLDSYTTRRIALSVARLVHTDADAAARHVPAGSYIDVMIRDSCASVAAAASGADDLDLLQPDGGYLVTSAPRGGGKVVRIGFPEPVWDPDTWPDAPVGTAESAARPPSETVVVIAQDAAIREALVVALTHAGYRVETLPTPSDAAGRIAHGTSEVTAVLCDVDGADDAFVARVQAYGTAIVPLRSHEVPPRETASADRPGLLSVPCTPPTLLAAIREALMR